MFPFRKRTDPRAEAAAALYETIVAVARQPVFYAEYGVPDTIDGRFDMVTLHAALVIHFLGTAGESGHKLSQQLFDTMFRDFMQNLRQVGIGDLSIARHFHRMAAGFNGRARAYAPALAGHNGAAITAAVARNVYRTPDAPHAAALGNYMFRQFEHLATVGTDRLLSGQLLFLPVLG